MTIVPREKLEHEIHRKRNAVVQEWARYRSLQKLLADHFPAA